MEENKGWYPLEGVPFPDSTETEIVENGIKYSVDFENGACYNEIIHTNRKEFYHEI